MKNQEEIGEMQAPVSRRTFARIRVAKPAPGTSVAKLIRDRSIRRSEVRVSFRLVPVELAIFYDRAAQGRTVTADKFRGGMNHDIQTMFQWAEEIRRREGIINDDRQAVGVSNVADGIEVRDIDGPIPSVSI